MKITMTRLRAKTVPKGTRRPEEATSGFSAARASWVGVGGSHSKEAGKAKLSGREVV